MKAGYHKLFRGFFITFIYITLGPIKIFPPFIGYLIMVAGLTSILSEYNDRSFESAKSCASLLALLNVVNIFLNMSSSTQSMGPFGNIILIMLFGLAETILYYYILEGTIHYLSDFYEKEAQQSYIYHMRYILIFSFLGYATQVIGSTFMNEWIAYISFFIVIITKIYFLSRMRKMYNIYPE